MAAHDFGQKQYGLEPSNSREVYIKNGWFGEDDLQWPGQKFSLEVEDVLINGKSKFQDILVFKSKTYGTVLALDGVIQVTERDEFAYQEMITHLPMFACKQSPKKVLIVGGGDGGVLREVVKHSSVEEIHMCEIDEHVISVSKDVFRGSLATAYDDSRLKLIIGDAAAYLREHGVGQNYDVIICDSSDPVGPADALFKLEFYQSMKAALNPDGGVLCTQGQCLWLDLEFIKNLKSQIQGIFASVMYAYTTIPTYSSGQIGFLLATIDPSLDVSVPLRPVPAAFADTLRYYTSALHQSSFVLPAFAAKVLGSK